MTQDERRGWLHAAFKALDDIPADKLESAVRDAMKTVDHPSKIVPAIRKALEGPGRYQSTATLSRPSAGEIDAARNDRVPRAGAKEMAALMRGLRERLERNTGGNAA